MELSTLRQLAKETLLNNNVGELVIGNYHLSLKKDDHCLIDGLMDLEGGCSIRYIQPLLSTEDLYRGEEEKECLIYLLGYTLGYLSSFSDDLRAIMLSGKNRDIAIFQGPNIIYTLTIVKGNIQ